MSLVPQAAHSGVNASLFGEHVVTPHIDHPSNPSAVDASAQHSENHIGGSSQSAKSNDGGFVETNSTAAGLTDAECSVQPPGVESNDFEANRAPETEIEKRCGPSKSRKRADSQRKGATRKLHRLAEVRQQQGVTERTMARRLGMDLKSYRKLEDPTCDLTLSQVMALQAALDVPIADLLEDHHTLSRPTQERAKLLKVMKTAVALREAKITPRADRMAQMLCEQLVDLMPELAEVSGWPQFGARRGVSAIGTALQHPIKTAGIVIPD